MPTELKSEELIPGATKVSSDCSPQVRTKDSSGWLGRTMAAASKSSLVTSNDLPVGGITDSSVMMSPAVTISVGNNGSVLPDAFNTGDALETYEKVSQKVSANPSVAERFSCKSLYMGMIKCTPMLQPHQFCPSTVRWTTSKELRETTKELNAEMFDSGGLQKAKERIDLLQQELRNSTDLNLQEQFNITLIQAIQNLYVLRLGSGSFVDNFGSKSMCTKLVSEELIPGAAKLSSDSPVQVGTSNSSGWLDGTIAAPPTSPQVTSNDLPVGGIMVSSNPSAGCSYNSSSIGMLKCTTMLQPRRFRPSTVRAKTSKKLQETIKELHVEIFSSDDIQKAKEDIDSLQQELINLTNLISQELSDLTWIQVMRNILVLRLKSTSFIDDFGSTIMSMEQTLRENDEILKDLQMGLLLNFDGTDPLLSEVKDIYTRNKAASRKTTKLACGVHDYRNRKPSELSWLFQFAENVRDYSLNFSAAITSEIADFQNYLLELGQIADKLASSNHSSHEYESQLSDLRTIFMIWESIDLLSKNCAFYVEAVTNFCSQCKTLRRIHKEKVDLAERFFRTEQDVRQDGPKLEKDISCLKLEVDRANASYVKKLSCIPKDRQRSEMKSHKFKEVTGHSDFSWRTRKYKNIYITPAMREQARGECSSVSTVSATESLHKKQYAIEINLGGNVYQADEFVIELSHNHLQDMVNQFYKMNKRKGNEKLAVCMEQMEEKGVVSESAYNKGDTKVQDFERYRINGFEELNIADFAGACAKLKEGNVLVGNFRVITEFYRLGPNDIYDIPADPVYVITPSGLISSHCVVIVGFGVTPEGEGYYVFQNSYGPTWGSGGYGRVSSRSLKYLYSPTL